jgi:putative transport protein
LNRRSLNQLASAFVMCFVGLLCVLAAAWMFGLDRGMAAGLAAGGLTQSAIIGTAGDAIGRLGLSPELTKTMQAMSRWATRFATSSARSVRSSW